MKKHLVAQIQDSVQASSCSMEELAGVLDKRPSSLYHELNPFPSDTSTAKLGLEDAVKIMGHIQDFTCLMQIADHFGFTLKRNNRKPDGKDLDEECLQGFQATARFIDAAKSGASTAELTELCCSAVNELEDVVRRARMERNPGLRKVG